MAGSAGRVSGNRLGGGLGRMAQMQIITQGVLKCHQKGNMNMQFARGEVH